MSHNPAISVVMPVFNAGAFLREAIDSVLSQTFKDFELILIDDGSTDNSAEIIESYHDSRIVYVSNGRNLKLIATLNRGIELSHGKYIARMDADDVCLPERLARQFDYLEKNEDVGVCGTWAYLIDSNSKKIGKVKNVGKPDLLEASLLFTCPIIHPSAMIRASVLKENRYSGEAVHVEDFDLWTRLSNKGVKMANICSFLLKYRWHGSNVSAIWSENQYRSKCSIIRPQIEKLLGRSISEEEMNLHEWSFHLYGFKESNKGKSENASEMLEKEKAWFKILSSANRSRHFISERNLDSLLLSRWIVACVACRKYHMFLALPSSFYFPSKLLDAAALLIQK